MTEDCLIISYDHSQDGTALTVARNDSGTVRVLNTIRGDAAFGIYYYLTGGAELKSAKEIPKKVVCDGDDESDYVHCPCCHEIIGSNDMVYDDFYYRDWKPMYCQECGQAMIWK